MSRRIRAVLNSLELRLLVPLAITVAAVLAVLALLNFRSTHDHFLGLAHGSADRASGLIQRATHDGMLLNQLDDVQLTIERLSDHPDVAAIRVYDKRGSIVLSAGRAEIGQRIALDSETCRSCHGKAETKDDAVMERSRLAQVPGGPEVLRHLTVIENEPACAAAPCHYHPADQRVLGVLDVEMSMAPLNKAIATSRAQFMTTTIVLIVISGFVAAVFIRRLIVQPAHALRDGTRRIAAGDLDTRIEVEGEHELAHLGQAFNQMVSELKAARQEITEWSQTLEQKVAEKTQKLRSAQRQVMHMEKMASLGKLSATVAHELNNPMSGMLTYARLVRREIAAQPIDEEVRAELDRYLNLLDKECSRCGSIVRNLLTFARQTGSEMVRIDLNDVIERSLMLVRHHLEISNVMLHSEVLTDDAEVIADGGQIQQALIALFVNAVEAMEESDSEKLELTVRLRGDLESVEIEVSDTGVGIVPEALHHIFEPFFSTKGESQSGVGLGLAVVYGIVNRHGGSIDVDSTPREGTTFRIRLPRRPAETASGDSGAWEQTTSSFTGRVDARGPMRGAEH